ncbi:MAG: I78 family peptidase inhibitor [Phenylobacterium sp.]
MKASPLIAAMLLLAACSTAPAPEPEPAGPPVAEAPPPSVTPADACGAAELQGLVGRPRSEIPIPVDPARQRVACTTCPVTMDFSPRRLNFFFDAETGIIKQIRCG